MDIDDYSTKYAAQYGGKGWFEQVMVRARRDMVIGTLERYPHTKILEVGCGLEPLFQHWQSFEMMTIVEPSPQFVEHARSIAPADKTVRIHQGFFEDQSSHLGNDFDVVVVSSLLHEVPRPDDLLHAVHAVSNPRTIVHLNVPNVRSFHRLLALEMGIISDPFEASQKEIALQRSRGFDKDRLLDAVVRAGFDVLRFETYFMKPFTHDQMEKIFDLGILPRSAIDGLMKLAKHFPEHGAEMLVELRPTPST